MLKLNLPVEKVEHMLFMNENMECSFYRDICRLINIDFDNDVESVNPRQIKVSKELWQQMSENMVNRFKEPGAMSYISNGPSMDEQLAYNEVCIEENAFVTRFKSQYWVSEPQLEYCDLCFDGFVIANITRDNPMPKTIVNIMTTPNVAQKIKCENDIVYEIIKYEDWSYRIIRNGQIIANGKIEKPNEAKYQYFAHFRANISIWAEWSKETCAKTTECLEHLCVSRPR